MVQYMSLARNGQPINLECDYWKLRPCYSPTRESLESALETAKYAYNKNECLSRLEILLSRAHRGLLSYEHCTHEELLDFCAKRGIKLDVVEPGMTELKLALEQADDKPTFNRFEDLPPELRLRTYDIHLSSFELPTTALYPPPLTKASKLLRQESFPLFFNDKCLVVPIHFSTAFTFEEDGSTPLAFEYDAIRSECSSEANIAKSVICRRLIDTASDLIIASIKNLHVSFRIDISDELGSDIPMDIVTFSWDIRMKPNSEEYTMGYTAFEVGENPSPYKLVRMGVVKNQVAAIEGKMIQLFEEMKGREEGLRLRREDLNKLKEYVQDTFLQDDEFEFLPQSDNIWG